MNRTIVIVGLAAALLVLPLFTNPYWTDVCVSIGLYALLALSLNVILGQAGIFHMGHAAFFAVGAYGTAILNTMYHWPIFLTMPVAGCAAALFALVVAGGCYFLGGFGRLFSDKIDIAANGYDSVIPTMLESLSPMLIALVVILVLSASMSTLSSLVIASSSTLTIDFIKDNIVKDMNEKKQVMVIRSFIVVFIAISAIIALVQYKSSVTFIAQLMGVSWGALAGSFLAPFLYSLYWKKTTVAACWVSFIWGCGLTFINMFARTSLPAIMQSPINMGAIAMLGGLIIVPLVSLVTPKPDKKLVDDAFECYNKTTVVAQKTALGE